MIITRPCFCEAHEGGIAVIAGDRLSPANDIIVDPPDSTLYLATDFGVFVTRNLGLNWSMLGDNLPNAPVVDLRFHQATRRLVAATYGRSMYTFGVDQLVGLQQEINTDGNDFTIFPNPAKDRIWINFSGSENDLQYQIFNMKGEMVSDGKSKSISGRVIIDLQELAYGEYLIRLFNNGKSVGIRKMLVLN
jgi:hypothetical protein